MRRMTLYELQLTRVPLERYYEHDASAALTSVSLTLPYGLSNGLSGLNLTH